MVVITIIGGIILFGFLALAVLIEVRSRHFSVSEEDCSSAQAAVLHCYMACGDRQITQRGRIVAEVAAEFCIRNALPLIIAAGYASRMTRPDQEIYAEFLTSHYPQLKIVLGNDTNVRSTTEEIAEVCRVAESHKWKVLAAFAIKSHLPRVRFHWTRHGGCDFTVRGIPGPLRFHFWEGAMIILEMLLPPGSLRREKILKLFRSKKPIAPSA